MVWVHVAAAAVWIGASACVIIAAGVLRPDSAELETFALRALPAIARLNLCAAAIVFVAGAIRLVQVGAPIDYQFRAEFLWILGAKMGLFGAMAASAVWSYMARSGGRAAGIGRELDAGALTGLVGRAAPLAAVAVVMGGLAAALGLWLVGLA